MSTVKPTAYKDQTDFPVPGGALHVPRVADNRAINNLTTRLKPYLGDFAGAAADVVVDPAGARQALADEEFEYQDTPSGRQLACLRVQAWTAGISADGANGRSRLVQQRSGQVDPWPLPTVNGPHPVLVYPTTGLDRMALAAAESSTQIITTDMVTRVRANERGIWNPPLAVVGVVATGSEQIPFVHSAEGSTRVSTAHHVVGTDHGAPLREAGSIRDLIRSERARVLSALAATPDSKAAQHAAKLLTCPLRIVVGVLDQDGNPCTDPFHEVVSEFVESVHEEPRPWDELAQGNALGERLMLRFNQEGTLDDDALADIVQRDDFYSAAATPSQITVQIARVATRPDADPILREVILADPTARNLTGRRKAAALAPLILRAHRRMPGLRDSAVAALSRPFLPAELSSSSWADSGRDIDALEAACLDHLANKPDTWSDDLRELCGRAVGPLCALGLILSDQGQAVDGISQLRGQVNEAVEGLAMSEGGVRLMADAVRRADGLDPLYPIKRRPDGMEITVEDSDGNQIPVRYDPASRNTNMEVRALALNDGVIPKNGGGGKSKPPAQSPEERFRALEDEFVQITGELVKAKELLLEVCGTDGKPIIDTMKLDGVRFQAVPDRLTEALGFVLQYRGLGVADPDGLPTAPIGGEGLDDEDGDEDDQEVVGSEGGAAP